MVAHNPLHRTGRMGLPHPVLASGNNAKPDSGLTHPLKCLLHARPALSPEHGALSRVLFGRSPSLHPLRTHTGGLFGGFPGILRPFDFPCPCIIGVCSQTSRRRSCQPLEFLSVIRPPVHQARRKTYYELGFKPYL